jgi:hypothetical protein
MKKWPLKTKLPSGRPLGTIGVVSRQRTIMGEKSFYARGRLKSSALANSGVS